MKTSALLSISTRISRTPDVVAESLQGETVMVNMETSRYYGLNRVGGRVWEMLARPTTVAELCEELLCEFKIDEETCRREVLALVQKLADEKLIRVHSQD